MPDLSLLPADALARPQSDEAGETAAALAAVLKAFGRPASIRDIRLAATLVLAPRLLPSIIAAEEVALWRRAVGEEAIPWPPGVVPFAPLAARSWGGAVRQLRGTGLLVEADATWGPGAGLSEIFTEGWPDGRARFVVAKVRELGAVAVIAALPEVVQRSIDVAAA